MTDRPPLIVVSGRPGSGKTTLAHAVARAVGCPAICRDEIREGMAHAGTPDPTMLRTYETFVATITLLLDAGVTVVAEAAFQDRVWRPTLLPLRERARIRVIRCVVDPALAFDRIRTRRSLPTRAAHDDAGHLERAPATWDPITLDVPTLEVDTTDGYRPGLDAVAAFAGG